MQNTALQHIYKHSKAFAALQIVFFILIFGQNAAAQAPAAGCESRYIERIWACEQYTWHDSLYTASSYSTSYTYPGANAQGCDSIVTLYLTIVRNSHTIEERTACDSYRWHDSVYTASTDSSTYTYARANSVGCDSVVHLHLTINRSDTGYTEMSVCGAWSMHDTTMIRTLTTQGCDSLVLIALNVHAHTAADRFDTVCGSFMWRDDQEFTSDDIIRYRDTNVAGCDSIVTLYLTVHPNIDTIIYDTACGSLFWNGVSYNGSGIYRYHGLSQHQCDSTVRLHLTIYSGSGTTYHQQACDSILWHDRYYSVAGTYTYHYVNSHGCASTDRLVLNVGARPDSAFHVSACNYYNWMGTTYYESGTYLYDYHAHGSDCIITDTLYLDIRRGSSSIDEIDACESYTWRDGQTYNQNVSNVRYHLTNAVGCDSAIYLHLNIHHPGASGTEYAMSCDSLLWHGTKLTQSGRYTFDTTSSPGCDSTLHLTLTLFRANGIQQDITACDSYRWRDDSLYTATTAEPTDTLINRFGCDSVIRLNLTINRSGSHADTVAACDSYRWHGTSYSQDGDYQYLGRTTHGCDSLMTLHLHVDRSTSSVDTLTACDSLVWRDGNTYTASTTLPVHTLTNAAGCDSLIGLRLTILRSHADTLRAAECESYVWRGDTLTMSGIYSYDTLTVQGCDSTRLLDLTVYPVTHQADTVTACSRYTWLGNTYTQSNDYAFIGLTSHGCDSIRTLNLTINQPSASDDTVTACDSLVWRNGNTYCQSTSTPYVTLVNAVGCDSVISLRLTIHHSGIGIRQVDACEQYLWEGDTLVRSGIYTHHALTTHGCDSTKQLILAIHHATKTPLTLQACDSLTWIDGVTYRQSDGYIAHTIPDRYGCDSMLFLTLTIHHSSPADTIADTACDSYVWHGSSYTQSGTYRQAGVNRYGCDSSQVLHLTLRRSTDSTMRLSACDSLVWIDGVTYRQSIDSPEMHLYNDAGCDSILRLHLTLRHSSPLTEIADTVCDSLRWDGSLLTRSGSYPLLTLNTQGCDSSVLLQLVVHRSSSSAYTDSVRYDSVYLWERSQQTYAEPGTYYYDYISDEGCPSTDTLYLLRDHWMPSYRMIGEVNDTHMGYVVVYPDTLLHAGETAFFIAVAHEGYQFFHWADGADDQVRSVVVENQDIRNKAFFIRFVGIDGVESAHMSVSPNPSDGLFNISVEGAELRNIDIYDLSGRLIYSSSEIQNPSAKADAPNSALNLTDLPEGTYLLRANTSRGPIVTKIIISGK